MLNRNMKNYLLVKDDVGRSKPTTRDLPKGDHAFGHAAIPDKEGVGACKIHLKKKLLTYNLPMLLMFLESQLIRFIFYCCFSVDELDDPPSVEEGDH